ncbi:YbbR-like domain-containing protein [uncultured Subdoligranulum sp.]|uniref:CdaR family protein n=1 Tax=uncultured Subdoligranulum sp. TaxID=512298 RepID=UPI0026142E6A|nr:CdaR family protein [uncultured Subdoligranulum sp.]
MPKPTDPKTPQPSTGRKSLWSYPLFSLILALFCGFVAWTVVAVYVDPQGSVTVQDVPINYANGASAYTSQGLDIVEKPSIETVDVRVDGNSTIIGNITNSDIMVYPSYAGVSGAGRVTLRLQARLVNTTDFPGDIECTVESPRTIEAVFDEVSEKTLAITVDASAVSVAEGYMLNRSAAVPAEITLRGPTSELDQIASVVATVSSDAELSDTTTVPATLELRDENGEVYTPQYTTMDSETANVTLTVYQVRELPLVVDFIGTPTNFDTRSLRYTLSQDTLRVAGPARTISALEELTVTNFDLSQEFELGRDYQRLVELPSGIVSLDGVTSVTLSFDTSDMGSTTLNISNISAINVPSNYEVEILSSMVSGVTLYGPAEEVEALSADSVVAQIDCQSVNLTVGQQTIPVTIQIPSSSRIFATGSYTVQCEVRAR